MRLNPHNPISRRFRDSGDMHPNIQYFAYEYVPWILSYIRPDNQPVSLAEINNHKSIAYNQSTPKARVLAASL